MVGVIERLKAVFNLLLLNTGVHAATTVKFCGICELFIYQYR